MSRRGGTCNKLDLRINRNGIAILGYSDGLSYRIRDRSKKFNSKRGNEVYVSPHLR
jgi:hypothetical protein